MYTSLSVFRCVGGVGYSSRVLYHGGQHVPTRLGGVPHETRLR